MDSPYSIDNTPTRPANRTGDVVQVSRWQVRTAARHCGGDLAHHAPPH
jgi:hypothetical protein